MSARIVMPDGDPLCERLFASPRRSRIIERLGGFEVFDDAPLEDPSVAVERCRGAEFVVFGWRLPDAVLELPGLRMVNFMGTGAANYVDLARARRNGVTVCNAPGYGDAAVAEHALALMLAAMRDIPEYHRELDSGSWVESRPALELSAATVGLIGFGGIARHLARILLATGARVLVHVRSPERWRQEYPGIEFTGLDELLSSIDIVSLHLSFNEGLRGFMSAERLERLRDGALFVNTARAELVDQGHLIRMLRDRRIRAALDVFEPEPLPRDHEFRGVPGLIMTPHVAFNTPASMERMADIVLRNIESFAEGSPIHVVE